jgi:hypothetical protein
MKTIRFKAGTNSVLIKLKDGAGMIETDFKAGDSDSEAEAAYDNAMDGLESLILAHACAGVDVKSPKCIEGVAVALEAMMNHFL